MQVQHLGDVFVRLEGQQVGHVLALGVPAGLGQFVGLGPVDAPEVGEEQQPVVGGGDEEVLHDVVAAQLGTLDALAAALLRAVVVAARALDVAAAGDGDHHFLFGNQVFHGHVAVVAHEDLGAAVVPVLGHDFRQLLLMISRWRSSEARIALNSAIIASSSVWRSWIFWRSRAASRRSCMSRIARAWTSSMSSSSISPSRAASVVLDARIRAMTSSSMSRALRRARRMCAPPRPCAVGSGYAGR